MATSYSHGDGMTESKEDDAAVTAAKLAYAGSCPSEIESQIIALRDQLNSTDEQVWVRATMQIRTLLTIERNPPIDSIIRAGVVPRMIYFLQVNSNHTLQFEAAWALTNIASGTSEHTRCVVEQGAVPIFIRLLSSPSEDVCEQAAWALGNITGDSVAFRDAALEAGAVPALLAFADTFKKLTRVSTIRNCTWTLSNLCRGWPQPNFATVSPMLPLLARLLNSKDEETITDACWALSYLSDGNKEAIDQVLSAGVAARLVELLGNQTPSAQAPALRAVGNTVTGSDLQTQAIIDLKVVPALLMMLDHPEQDIRKEACWTLSNITAGTPEQIQCVLSAGVIPKLIKHLLSGDLDIQKEATWAISNATLGGYPNQILKLARLGCIAPLCGMLDCQDIEVVNRALEGLENFLKTGRKLLTAEVEDEVQFCDGVSSIERLQSRHGRDGKIYRRASNILRTYFADAEANILIAPQGWSTVNAEGRYAFTRTLYRIRKQYQPKLGFLQALFIQFEFGPHLPSTMTLTGDEDIITGGLSVGADTGPWVYSGEVLNGLRHGTGTCTWPCSPDGTLKYEGQWRYGLAHGNCRITAARGDVFGWGYEGQYRSGLKHGTGKYTWPDGRVYQGDYCEDKRNGTGKQTWPSGKVYEGEYRDNKMHGAGKYTWSSGQVYEGEYHEDQMHGRGKCTNNDNSVYEGEVYDGKAHGRGKKTWPDGRVYQGDWSDNKMHGRGVYTWPNGQVYKGQWYKDRKQGKGKMKLADGSIFHDGRWDNDVPALEMTKR